MHLNNFHRFRVRVGEVRCKNIDFSLVSIQRQPTGSGWDAQLGPGGRRTQQEPFAGRSREKWTYIGKLFGISM